MSQDNAVFADGTRYIRMKATGWVYPEHDETSRMVKKGTAEYVTREGDKWKVVKLSEEAIAKKISTPARKPDWMAPETEAKVELADVPPVAPKVVKVVPVAAKPVALDFGNEE